MVDQFGVSAKGKQNRRRAQEGRGTGRGRAYKPQLRVQDVASKGRSTRMPVDGRMAHLLSDLEARLALNLRWSPHISNVREQVPLPLEHTIAIAEQMGIAHPKVRGDSAPLVLTTDLVADYDDGKLAVVCARSVKPASALDLRNGGRPDSARVLTRTIAILEIERRFWQSQGADWRLVCEHDLDRTRAANIQLFLGCEDLDPAFGPMYWDDALELVRRTLKQGDDYSLDELGNQLENRGKLTRRHLMECVRHLCVTRDITFDMTRHFGPDLRACDFTWTPA